jgi:hypothetical protein
MNNTIKLIKGDEILTRDEWKKFKKHDSILGIDRTPEELQMWSITQEADAKAELAKWDSEAQKEIVNILADIIESDELIGFDRNDILSLVN